MITRHTPGPWEARKSEWCEWDVHVPARESRGLLYIVAGDVGGDSSGAMYGTPEDNARLIAAAPELLDALRELVDDITDRFDMSSESTNPGLRIAVNAARAAIAKATGETP